MDVLVIAAIQAVVERYPAYYFCKIFTVLRRQKHPWNHKRIYGVYCSLKPNMRRKGKKRLPKRYPEPQAVPADMDQCCSMVFMSDALSYGRRFRAFNVIDAYRREALAI